MDVEFQRRTEIRAEGNALIGTALVYGDKADIGGGMLETFLPGSLYWDDVILNRQHTRVFPLARTGGGGLTVTGDMKSVTFRAELPDTQEGRDTRELVKAGVLRGASVEFKAERERQEGPLRVIERAMLRGIGIVDSGAYPESTIEARQRRGGLGRIRSRIPFNRRLQCRCHRGSGSCNSVSFSASAFDEAIEDKRLIAVSKDYASPLASTAKDTLRLKKTDARFRCGD